MNPVEIRFDHQLKRRDSVKVDLIIFHFFSGTLRAEVPLLPYELF